MYCHVHVQMNYVIMLTTSMRSHLFMKIFVNRYGTPVPVRSICVRAVNLQIISFQAGMTILKNLINTLGIIMLVWNDFGKPRQGSAYELMRRSR